MIDGRTDINIHSLRRSEFVQESSIYVGFNEQSEKRENRQLFQAVIQPLSTYNL